MSAADHAREDSGSREGTGVLTSRLIDIDRERFSEEYWARRALLTRGASDFSDIFSADAVDELVSRRGLRSPFLRVAKDGATLPTASFTSGAGVGATISDQLDDTALWRQFDDGATLVLQALQRTWEPIGRLVSSLNDELGNPVQANAYITPPQNQGFDDHYDVHDVFVLQISGTKRWVIHEPVFPDPLRDQPWTDRREQVGAAAATEPATDAVLEPGDVLYLPRGWLHAAQAQGEVSIHVTLGIHNRTAYAVAEEITASLLRDLRDDPELRRSLPLGHRGPDPATVAAITARMREALDDVDPGPGLHRIRRTEARPAPLGPLAQRRFTSELHPESIVRLRGGLEARFVGDRLMTRVGWLDFSDDDREVVRRLVDREPADRSDSVRAEALGVELAKRLLRAGVLVPGDD